jgi:hypothetical protein
MGRVTALPSSSSTGSAKVVHLSPDYHMQDGGYCWDNRGHHSHGQHAKVFKPHASSTIIWAHLHKE